MRRKITRVNLQIGFFVGLLLTGCAISRPIQTVTAGDRVQMAYTCRTSDGRVAATTLAAVGQDSKLVKADIFQAPSQYAPFHFHAAEAERSAVSHVGGSRLVAFETAIERELKKNIVGLNMGETVHLALQADAYVGLSQSQRYYTLAKVRIREKVRNYAIQTYMANTGTAPQVGEHYLTENVFINTITAVDEEAGTFAVEMLLKPGAVYQTDVGPAKIEDNGDTYHIVLNAIPGQLVRNGNWVGRIIKVDQRRIVVDWGHPFGFETLQCAVVVQPDGSGP